jgi:hypothetical protein
MGLSIGVKNNAFRPVIRHWTGKAWTVVTLPAKVAKAWSAAPPIQVQIAATSNTNVWAFGNYRGSYLRLSGKRWSIGYLPGARSANLIEITSAKIFSARDLWAFGAEFTVSGKNVPYAAHFNGSKWTGVKVPGTGGVLSVGAVSSRDLWAVVGSPATFPATAGSTPRVLRWTASSAVWQPATVQPKLPAGAQIGTMLAEPNGTVWIGGSVRNGHQGRTEVAARWTPNATAWSVTSLPAWASKAQFSLIQLAPDGRGGIWGVGQALYVKAEPDRLWHLTGSTWSRVTPDFGKHWWVLFQLSAVPGTRSVWAVGAQKVGNGAVGLIAVEGVTPR